MISLESITPDLALTGLDPTGIGTVIAVVPIADGAVQVFYRTHDGGLAKRQFNSWKKQNTVPDTGTNGTQGGSRSPKKIAPDCPDGSQGGNRYVLFTSGQRFLMWEHL